MQYIVYDDGTIYYTQYILHTSWMTQHYALPIGMKPN